ncbi:MAG: hypothetical protein CM1200mP18_18790 [Gammaproteobacteria bacterium]|nr:MAG: hypothetical protein CM1200mP18_18790 [Gammaproteobacteria bacterium]
MNEITVQVCATSGSDGPVILTSNKLVQYPVQGNLWGLILRGFSPGVRSPTRGRFCHGHHQPDLRCGDCTKVVYIGFVFGLVLTITVGLGIAMTNESGDNADPKSVWDELAFDMFRIAWHRHGIPDRSVVGCAIFNRLRQFNGGKRRRFVVSGLLLDTVFFFLAFARDWLPWASWASVICCQAGNDCRVVVPI